MQFLTFIVSTITQLYIIILLFRVWMQLVKIDFYHPVSQFVVKLTELVMRPLHRFIPSINMFDTATLLVSYILTVVNIIFIMWVSNTLTLISIKLLLISIIQLLTYSGKLVFWLILIRVFFSWISQGSNPIDYAIMQLTEIIISPIRKIVPIINGIDFSPMIVTLILIALDYLRLNILLFIDPDVTNILYSIGYMI
ncbi:YGGT family protein [Candidatus Arsenophonus lipoptenae]|uniref:YGGT family protein n=1 Tax=Candidatus Arsenophonus lipoptenae TaxID=634113 RepID=A0A0X9VM30_9GAMM|nr:YggT family protein [Candidatus Arsenophonus lipoptenae]AMA64746.1 YGGT family protein [Candidatus Arsenophonus lipoptenae]